MSTNRPAIRTVRQAVVLAGGLGTRMFPRTERVPKFLLPVRGTPFGALLLSRLAACGFDEAVLCIGHLGEQVREAFGDGSALGIRIVWSDEGEARLGTAGAIRLALPRLAATFLVTYGDSYLPFDYAAPLADLEAHAEALGTMAVFRNADRHDASNTVVSGDRVVRYGKRAAHEPRDPEMDHIDYGATALRREVVERLPGTTPIDLSIVQRDLARAGQLRALHATERFFEIGSERGLRDLEAHLAERAANEGSFGPRDAAVETPNEGASPARDAEEGS